MCLHTPFFCSLYHKVSCLTRQMILFFFTLALIGCATEKKMPSNAQGFILSANQEITKAGENTFQNGGNAADAMSAMLMSGAVLLPSRMGLGAGGICQVLDPAEARVKTLDFLSRPMSFDKQIGIPALAKGVYTLQNKYGLKPWAEILQNPIQKAQNGVKVSDMLAKDILSTTGLDSSWKNLKKGDVLTQPKLAKTLKTLSSKGAGVLYKGKIADSIVSQSTQIISQDLKNFKVSFMDSIDVTTPFAKTYFPNPTILSSDGYMIWRNATSDKEARQQKAKEDMIVLQNRTFDNQTKGISLISADKNGLVIVCNVSMGSAFGSTQLTEEGFYLAQTIKHTDMPVVFANILQTNPDITDMTTAVAGVENYALLGALNELSDKDDAENISSDSLISMTCEKGYPNHASSCAENENLHFVFSKID